MSITPELPLIPRLKANAIMNLLARGQRIDKRKLEEYRDIEVRIGYIPNAEGSAYVRMGNTQVLAGVKLEVGQPYSDAPNEGVLIVNAEFIPAASPSFEPGPPDENAIELARVIDRSLREPRVVALDKLAIIPGKKVWIVWLDIYVLDHDGNLIDASMLASMAALLSTRVPTVAVDKESGEVTVKRGEFQGLLPINRLVTTVTVYKIGNYLVVDPTQEEEALSGARLTVAVTEEGLIAGMQKAGMDYLSDAEVERAVEIALSKAPLLIGKIREAAKGIRGEGGEASNAGKQG
ncbi:MAG: exosome complex component Rrp42 [Thermoprotei archaeon]|nr:MAG: exosome complex component Rrp42 [Thermoprotei archaeon]